MAPKNKGKKGKKQDDDEYWAVAGESIGGNNAADAVTGKKDEYLKDMGVDVEEGEDFGGLMSAINNASKKDKKKKPKANFAVLQADKAPEDDAAPNGGPSEPVAVTADDFDDDDFGPSNKAGKKGKKNGQVAELLGDEGAPAGDDLDGGEDEEGGGVKILSKKEKERLKKEKEKAKKKEKAAAKKTATKADAGGANDEDTRPAAATPTTAVSALPATAEEKDGEEDGEEEGAAAGAGGKKKKKKKAKKEEEPAPPPPKKGGIGAKLKKAIEERNRLEEEARKRQEEIERREREEEERAKEEAARIAEEKARKKEKEKAKKEQLKKEGKLLTPKQKAEQKAAELRRKALEQSGMIVEGLRQTQAEKPKKVVYNNRKKKVGPKKDDEASVTQASTPESMSPALRTSDLPVSEPPESPRSAGTPTAEVKDDWDAESEEEKPPQSAASTADVKDDWDASSEDEAPATPADDAPKSSAPSQASTMASQAPSPHVQTPSVVAKGKQQTDKPVAVSKAKAESESESDEDDSDEDSDSEESTDSDSEEDSSEDEQISNARKIALQRKADAAERKRKAHEAAMAARSKDDLRSPICCILGHVDTGKTKLLDKIRQTNVQEGEAGGITQQIGATYFPLDAIKTKTAVVNKDGLQEYKIPGLLVIDTPGHESFTNLRSRGSSLCNIAILVVDIMHGLEPQTLESLRLLRDRKSPFIVALNKIDRLYGWEAIPDNAFQDSLAKQKPSVRREFEDRLQKTILAFAEQGLNAVLYYENKSFARNVSLVPTSAITGEGVPDMIMLLVNLTQQRMSDRLMYLSELECTVLEVKVIEGLGTTIDVVLSNGILREGDRIVVCGLNGPICTQVRALLTPQPLRELRIKSQYVHHKEVKAALGVKIAAPDLDKAIAGSRLLVLGPDDDEDDLKEEVMGDLTTLLNSIDKSGRGVCVQASTLGSLEALLDFLKVSKIPVSGINIGPVHKKDVMRCATVLEKAKELACILCFDVPVDKDAERLADELGIKLFKADIIYHLFDAFTAYNADIMEAKRKDAAPQAVWPCRLKTIACFAKRDPIILGVDILDGSLRVGTPLCVVKTDPATQKREIIDLGKITSLEINHKSMDVVKKAQAGGGVAVKIEHAVYQSAKMFGRHFEEKDELYSHITRASIDILKSTFKADVSTEEWLLIKNLKPILNIQ